MLNPYRQLAVLLSLFPVLLEMHAAHADTSPFENPHQVRPVIIDYYFEPGCDDCKRVESVILPQLEASCAGLYVLNRWDVDIETNYFRLAGVLDRLGGKQNEYVFMVIDGKYLLEGYASIDARLFETIGICLRQAEPSAGHPASEKTSARAEDRTIIAERMRRFTFPGVSVAGLIDGINPCAISTLVFFISLLSISHIRGRPLLVCGLAFCLGSFLTYFAIGFGLLHALRAFWTFAVMQQTVNFVMFLLLLILALLSFRDAARYRASRDPADVTLQLPDRIKLRIHRLMRERLRSGRLVSVAFGIGAGVTVLESVCTGQVYLPTLVYVVKSGTAPVRGLACLLLYNFFFILPLIIVFAATYLGLKFTRLMVWSARNVVISKILLGCFFILMAVLFAIF